MIVYTLLWVYFFCYVYTYCRYISFVTCTCYRGYWLL